MTVGAMRWIFASLTFIGQVSTFCDHPSYANCPLNHGSHFHGFPTLGETEQLLESWWHKYPNHLKRYQFGSTYRERPIWMYKMTNFLNDGEKSGVVMDALLHAREPAGLVTLLYYMGRTLETGSRSANPDPEAFYTLERRIIYFIPVWNVDGYLANEEQYEKNKDDREFIPMVRKNLNPACEDAVSPECPECQGVDLNRNWSINFKKGSDTCDMGYGGEEPFSEPETLAFKNWIEKPRVKIKLAYNFHSYGSLLTHPMNSQEHEGLSKEDSKIYKEINDVFHYQLAGNAYNTVHYLAYGEADDWMYKKKHIISLSPEVGSAENGFWPKPDITPGIWLRGFPRAKYVVYKAGCEFFVTRQNDYYYRIKNAGLDDCPESLLGIRKKDSDNPNHMSVRNLPRIPARKEVLESVRTKWESEEICIKEKGIPVCLCKFGDHPGTGVWFDDENPLCALLAMKDYSLPIDDKTGYLYHTRLQALNSKLRWDQEINHGSHFHGYQTLAEAELMLDGWIQKFSNYITREMIGTSYEGRPMHVYIVTNKTRTVEKPGILFDSLLHGNEATSLTVALYFMGMLLHHAHEPFAQYLLSERTIYFIPFMNPDAWVRNHEDKDKYYQYRKNIRPGCENKKDEGVNLESNFGTATQMVQLPCDSQYGGSAPFSEPETLALKNFLTRTARNITMIYNLHGYGQKVRIPFYENHHDEPIYKDLKEIHTSFEWILYNETSPNDMLQYMSHRHHSQDRPMEISDVEDELTSRIIVLSAHIGYSEDGYWPSADIAHMLWEANFPRLQYIAQKSGCQIGITTTPSQITITNRGAAPCHQVIIGIAKNITDTAPTETYQIDALPVLQQKVWDVDQKKIENAEPIICIRELNSNVCSCNVNKLGQGTWVSSENNLVCSQLQYKEQIVEEFENVAKKETLEKEYEYVARLLNTEMKYKRKTGDIIGVHRDTMRKADDEVESDWVKRLSNGRMYRKYPSFDETRNLCRDWVEKYPNLISKQEIGKSFQQRPLLVYTLTDQREQRLKAQVFMDALLHAREPAGLVVLLYFMGKLLEKADAGDPEAMYLLKTREIFCFPVWNPDAYVFNEHNKQHMNRKNMRDVCRNGQEDSRGVDLNRNFPIAWKLVNDECDEEYGGTEPFSEPEVAAFRDFLDSHDIKVCYNIHTYGQMMTHPNNYEKRSTLPKDIEAIYSEIKQVFRWKLFGTAWQTVQYQTFGESDDWIYNSHKILTMSPEVGPEEGNFWPVPDIAKGIWERNYPRTKYIVLKAGCEILIEPPNAKALRLKIYNRGVSDCQKIIIGVADENFQNMVVRHTEGGIIKRTKVDVKLNFKKYNIPTKKYIHCSVEGDLDICTCNVTKPGTAEFKGKDHKLCGKMIEERDKKEETTKLPVTKPVAPVPEKPVDDKSSQVEQKSTQPHVQPGKPDETKPMPTQPPAQPPKDPYIGPFAAAILIFIVLFLCVLRRSNQNKVIHKPITMDFDEFYPDPIGATDLPEDRPLDQFT